MSRSRPLLWWLGGIVLAAAVMQPAGGATSSSSATAIVGVDVLPMTGRERLKDQTVIIEADRISVVGAREAVKIPSCARQIDGSGQVLMPGLVDMHVHLAPTPGVAGDAAQRSLAVMLAYGVTTARTMAGSPQNLVVRGKIEAGVIAGPRLYVAAPALHEKSISSAAEARAAVRNAKAAGFDLIKSHNLPNPSTWLAVQDEARALGIPVAGHVTNSVGLDRALASGQQIEHLDSIIAALIPASAPEKNIDFGQIPPQPVLAQVVSTTDQQLLQLGARVAAAKSWHVPTLSLFEKLLDLSTPTAALAARPEMRFIPEPVLQQWKGQRAQMQKSGITTAHGELTILLRRRITSALHRSGVPLMAGSDTAQAFHVWGPALHKEIRSLHAAGLSRIEALRSATVVPREYFRSLASGGSALGWKAEFGTVERGARADLILLPADPSQDISKLQRPNLVITGGRVYDRVALDALLQQAVQDAQ